MEQKNIVNSPGEKWNKKQFDKIKKNRRKKKK